MSYYTTNKTVNIFRLTRSGNTDEYAVSPTYSDIDTLILPANAEIMAVYPGENAYQLHEAFIFGNISLLNGDKFTDVNNGDNYILRGAPRVYDTPKLYYMQCIVEKVVGQ